MSVLLGLTYYLNRPCLYCSLLLIILFATSCHWSQSCLIDFNYVPRKEGGSGYATWFIPRIQTLGERSINDSLSLANETLSYAVSALANTTVASLTEAVARMSGTTVVESVTGGYLSSMFATVKELFRREWVIPCIGTRVVL